MNKICIIGGGRFGTALAECLSEGGADVLFIDKKREIVKDMSAIVSVAVEADATNVNALRECGVEECSTAVVAIATDVDKSVLTTMNLKDLKIPNIVAKAGSELHGKVLERLGANIVIHPDKERAQRLAKSLLAKSALEYFQISEGVSVVEMKAPIDFVGKTLIDANIRREHGVTVLAMKRQSDKKETIINPTADDIILDGDTLVIFGPNDKLENLA